MEFRVKTPTQNIILEALSGFISKKNIKTDRVYFLELCKKCRNYNKKYACPPKSADFGSICNKEGLFIICFKCGLSQIRTTEFNKIRIANSVMKSRIDKLMRRLEERFCTKFLSSGSCRLCKICNLQKNLPCKYPQKMRFSLEATGIDVDFITRKLFNLPLLWYDSKNHKAPEYTCVVAGLLCDEKSASEITSESATAISEIVNTKTI